MFVSLGYKEEQLGQQPALTCFGVCSAYEITNWSDIYLFDSTTKK